VPDRPFRVTTADGRPVSASFDAAKKLLTFPTRPGAAYRVVRR
jgi:hypothetical protein